MYYYKVIAIIKALSIKIISKQLFKNENFHSFLNNKIIEQIITIIQF